MIDVPALVADATGAEVFCCGPTQLIDAVARWRESAAASTYTSSASDRCRGPAPRQPQRLRWSSRTGRVVDVASEQTVLDAVRAAGVNAPCSCEMGVPAAGQMSVCSSTGLSGSPTESRRQAR